MSFSRMCTRVDNFPTLSSLVKLHRSWNQARQVPKRSLLPLLKMLGESLSVTSQLTVECRTERAKNG